MALTVEDGTQVSGSNSYVSRADYIAFASDRGITIVDDVTADEQLIKAADYIDRHEQSFVGTKISRDQSMAWPRSDVYIDGFYYDTDEIPGQLIVCQIEYALLINDGEDLYNRSSNPNQTVKSEEISGAVKVEYAVKQNGSGQTVKFSAADALLQRLVKPVSMSMTAIRA